MKNVKVPTSDSLVLSQSASIAIPKLATWLKSVGLKLTITVCEDPEQQNVA